MVAIIVIRRGLKERRRLTTAHTTKARLITGMEYTANIIPIIVVLIVLSMICDVAARAAIIRITAIQRSDLGALLKKVHQTTIANPHIIPPNTPIAITEFPGTIEGRPNLTNHCSITITTPGHNRSGFC
jgi:hypothetical protein